MALSLVGLDVGGVRAATITVTNANNAGVGSLRQAVLDAVDGDTIDFSNFFNSARTISFTALANEITINKNLTITGPGSGLLTIDAGTFGRIFNISDNTKTVALSGMKLTNGKVTGLGGSGGAIYNVSTTTLTDLIITSNQASVFGGGVASIGPLTINSSTISQNTSGTSGGGVSNSAALIITDSTISGNTASSLGGGGVVSTNSTTISGSTISGNTATTGDGGGINGTGALTATNSTISNNTATSGNGGGINNTGAVTITGSTVSGNTAGGTTLLTGSGGGILASSGIVTVKQSTISGNSAAGTNANSGSGGGLLALNASATSVIANSTFSGNTARQGGAISINTFAAASTLTVQNTTIGTNTASSSANGIRVVGGLAVNATLNIGNTILDNASGNIVKAGTTARAIVNSQGGNIARDAAGLAGSGDLNSTDPLLDASGLQNNGGATKTIVLQATSQARGIGIAGTCTNANVSSVDQRNITRPQGTNCDAGATESRATTLVSDDVRAPAGGTMTLKATLTDTSGTAVALSGQTIIFKLNSTQICNNAGGGFPAACPTTDSNGVAELTGVAVPTTPLGLNANAIEASFAGATDNLPTSDLSDLTILTPQYIDFPQPGAVTYGDVPFTINATAKKQSDNSPAGLQVTFTSQTTGTCTVGSSSLSSNVSQVTVTIVAAGNCTIEATQEGDNTYAPATPVSRTITINKKSLTVTANDTTRPFGSSVVPCPVTLTGFVYNEDSSVVGGAATCSTTATTSSGPGTTHPLTPAVGSLSAANYTFGPFVNGVLTIGIAESAITKVALTGTYGSTTGTLTATLKRPYDNKPIANMTITFKVNGVAVCGGGGQPTCPKTNTQGVATLGGQTVPLRNAGSYNDYLIEASFAGDASYLASVGQGKLEIERAILWVKPVDLTVKLKQPNPTGCTLQLANGSTFVADDDWSDLNLTNLRCTNSRNYPNSNSSETVGKTYKISATGATAKNYDIRYQQGTLTVVP